MTGVLDPRPRTPRLTLTAENLLEGAICVLEKKGLAGITMRPLAQQLGVSVSAVTNRFGQKTEILAALCVAGAAQEKEILDVWRQRIGATGRLPPEAIADIADRLIDDLHQTAFGLIRLHCEILQATAWQPELRAPLAAWLEMRADFWSELARRSTYRPLFELGELLSSYATDELAHTIALGGNADYRWMRKLGLRRLCQGFFVDAPAWDEVSFEAVHARLGPEDEAGPRYQVGPRSKFVENVAPYIAALIIEGGSEAVTHRSVGQRADVAATTLVYHFPRQADLLKAGLEAMIFDSHLLFDTNARKEAGNANFGGPDLIVATYAVALATARFPELRPFAADMRRRRGENALPIMRDMSEAPERIDRLAAQSFAVAMAGRVQWHRAAGDPDPVGQALDLLELCRRPVAMPKVRYSNK